MENLWYYKHYEKVKSIMQYNRLQLRIPRYEELDYRKKLLANTETMSYNKGYDEFNGYDKETGCIDFNENSWDHWFSCWVNKTPNRYYAYIIKIHENRPIGEVALRYVEEKSAHCVSIILEAKYRGNGYSEEALRLLVNTAFHELRLEKIFDDFPSTRVSAEKVFNKVGFKRSSDHIVELTKADYLKL
jgi:RimJ/RimL family protein N-acetyltransferase